VSEETLGWEPRVDCPTGLEALSLGCGLVPELGAAGIGDASRAAGRVFAMRRINTLVFVSVLLVMSATPASADSVDRASSRAFISDAVALDRTLIIHHTEMEAGTSAFVSQIASACPGALVNDPIVDGTKAQGNTFKTLITEADFELSLAALDPVRPLTTAFTLELAKLRWSSPKISRAVAAEREALDAVFALEPPNFCADASASAASQFANVPSDASQFVAAFQAIPQNEQGGLLQIAKMMKPFLTTGQLTGLTRLKNLQARQEELGNLEPAAQRLVLVLIRK